MSNLTSFFHMGWLNQQPENRQIFAEFREKKPRPTWLSALQSYCKSITGLLVCGPEMGQEKSGWLWVQHSLIASYLGGMMPYLAIG